MQCLQSGHCLPIISYQWSSIIPVPLSAAVRPTRMMSAKSGDFKLRPFWCEQRLSQSKILSPQPHLHAIILLGSDKIRAMEAELESRWSFFMERERDRERKPFWACQVFIIKAIGFLPLVPGTQPKSRELVGCSAQKSIRLAGSTSDWTEGFQRKGRLTKIHIPKPSQSTRRAPSLSWKLHL